jgi:hypothetical protein
MSPALVLTSVKAGELDGATIGYGVGNWHLYNDKRDDARRIFHDIVERNPNQWPSFGYVASEAELAVVRK